MAKRDLNIELLRLLCMAGILLMHCIGLSVYPGVWDPQCKLDLNIVLCTIICSATILSVNIFGLISGYYGIKFSVDGILRLYLACAFYGLIGSLFGFFCMMAQPLKIFFLKLSCHFLTPMIYGSFLVMWVYMYYLQF